MNKRKKELWNYVYIKDRQVLKGQEIELVFIVMVTSSVKVFLSWGLYTSAEGWTSEGQVPPWNTKFHGYAYFLWSGSVDRKKKKDNLLRTCLVRGLGKKQTRNVLKDCRPGKKNFS